MIDTKVLSEKTEKSADPVGMLEENVKYLFEVTDVRPFEAQADGSFRAQIDFIQPDNNVRARLWLSTRANQKWVINVFAKAINATGAPIGEIPELAKGHKILATVQARENTFTGRDGVERTRTNYSIWRIDTTDEALEETGALGDPIIPKEDSDADLKAKAKEAINPAPAPAQKSTAEMTPDELLEWAKAEQARRGNTF